MVFFTKEMLFELIFTLFDFEMGSSTRIVVIDEKKKQLCLARYHHLFLIYYAGIQTKQKIIHITVGGNI